MQRLTTKHCIKQASEMDVPIYGDVSFGGESNLEDGELATYHQWAIAKYPFIADMCFHPANEWRPDNNKSSYSHYSKMLNKGYKPRLGDWVLLGINGAPPFVLEMKRENIQKSLQNRESKLHFLEQISLLASQKKNGAIVCVALGANNGKQALTEYVEKYLEQRIGT